MAELLCCKRFDFAEGKVQKTKSFLNSKKRENRKRNRLYFSWKESKNLFSSKIDDKLITTFGNPDISSRRGVLL
jgi:hypothetical protein